MAPSVAGGADQTRHILFPDIGVDEIRLETGVQILAGEFMRIGEITPAIVMHADMQGLAAVAHEMRPNAQITQGQHLPPPAVLLQPFAVGGAFGEFRARHIGPPQRKILHQLLIAVDDGIGQPAGLVLVGARGPKRGVELQAACGQRIEPGPAQHCAVIGKIHEMAGVQIRVMGIAGMARTVRLAREFADRRHRIRGPQERGHGLGKIPRRYFADDAVPKRAPGLRRSASPRQRQKDKGRYRARGCMARFLNSVR